MLNQQQIKMLFSLQDDPLQDDMMQSAPQESVNIFELDTLPMLVNIPECGYDELDLADTLAKGLVQHILESHVGSHL